MRTIGYVECFVLAKEDVLSAIRDYPEAQVKKNRQNIGEEKIYKFPFSNSKKITLRLSRAGTETATFVHLAYKNFVQKKK